MDPPSQSAGGPDLAAKAKTLERSILLEGLAALVFGIAGLALVVIDRQPEWRGFGLLALALLLYLMRGQVITKLTVGKDGIAWEAAQRALETAQSAKKEAEFASGVVAQQLPAGGTTNPLTGSGAPDALAGTEDRWSHPALDQQNKGRAVDPDDPQKGRWGGEAIRNGRQLEARYERTERGWVTVTLQVRSTDPARPLVSAVRFHLHDSFPRMVVTKKPVDGVAELTRYSWGAYTVGAEVAGEPDTYLELDLSQDPDAPVGWKDR